MSSLHLVDPELRPLVEALPVPRITLDNLDALRNRTLAPTDEEALALPVSVETLAVPGAPGGPPVGLMLFRPERAAGAAPAMLHIHGGGFIRGSARENEGALRRLCAELQCLIASVDYRLAPEAPFPAAIQDCYAALTWLHGEATNLGIDPACIGVTGESAGAGLAASLAILARDRGELGVAFQHLHYPVLDDRTCLGPPAPFTGEFVWPMDNHRFAWRCLLGRDPGGPLLSPYAAAARAVDLTGLPPAFIGVGALDLLVAENIDYARRLMAAGVATELHVIPGAFHGFDRIGTSELGARYRRLSIDSLRRIIAGALAERPTCAVRGPWG